MINLNTSSNSSLLQQVQQKQNSLMEKLASGKRVNSAADDAAAQQIIDRLTSQVEGTSRAMSNAYDGVSLSQVAEGGLSGITEDAQRIRELTVQAGNGIYSAADRKAIQSEISQLQGNISQTIENTEFAGKKLLTEDGSADFLVGANSGNTLSVNTSNIASGISDLLSIDVSDASSIDDALSAADSAIDYVDSTRADLGATQNQFESAARNLSQANVNQAAARSRLQDTDYAQATSDSASANILSQSSLAVQVQSNQSKGQVLSLLG